MFFYLVLFVVCFWVKSRFLVRFIMEQKISNQPSRVKNKILGQRIYTLIGLPFLWSFGLRVFLANTA